MSTSFTQHLYGPYLDLGPAVDDAPFHVLGVAWTADALLREAPRSRIQASVNRSFRDELCTGDLGRHAVTQVDELPDDLRSDDWLQVVALTTRATDLDDEMLFRLGVLISKLGLHAQAAAVVRDVGRSRTLSEDCRYLLSWADFRASRDDPTVSYDRSGFADIATDGTPGITAVDAAYQMSMQSAKFDRDADALEFWQVVHARRLEEVADEMDAQEHLRYVSRYHRVHGFLPQLRGDGPGMVAEMAEAERIARGLRRSTPRESVLADEMLFPVLESRMQEARWLREWDLALERMDEYLTMSPYDPTGWRHRGEISVAQHDWAAAADAFQRAAVFAPPGRAKVLFLRGQCLEKSGDDALALAAYHECIASDPLAVSAIRGVERVGARLGLTAMQQWARTRNETLLQH